VATKVPKYIENHTWQIAMENAVEKERAESLRRQTIDDLERKIRNLEQRR
jgi:hypothetical protein